MIAHAELVTLILGLALAAFLIFNRDRLRRLPGWGWLTAAIGSMLLAWIATIVEGFLAHDLFNHLEHLTYAAAAVFLAGWVWRGHRAVRP
ncbi:MAG TPA: hypothetical protein PK668_23070 [Myxococcota bacterium]|nr:hypothetical protein [Myxococcota bacterium]HRY95578.1 hypothetical protein [Myxococcota bacterium]HSA22583.1 hypothetical protein [Myxococcota bacterium]